MYTQEALLDLHERAQRSLKHLLDHCHGLPDGVIDQEFDGFGYPTIRLQLHHLIGAHEYWIGVLQGRVEADEDDHKYRTAGALEAYRSNVENLTNEYLSNASGAELNTVVTRDTWGGRKLDLMPAHVFLRTMTHMYHHVGQIQAICRLLDQPVGRLDFPLD